MVDPTDSFLRDRLAELSDGEAAIPLGYDELREAAREHLPKERYDYAAGGAGTEDTMAENRAAFERYRIVTRVLRDVSERDLSTTLFGRQVAGPLVLAPIGGQDTYHGEGELATARAAGELAIPMALSTRASRTIEDVAAANGAGPRLFQLYWPTEWAVAESLVERAAAADYDGILLTVDSALPKWRRRALRHVRSAERSGPSAVLESDPVVQRLADAAGKSAAAYADDSGMLDTDASLTWEDLDTLREWSDVPVLLKGIQTADDARRAIDRGIDGVVVSNHGGRQIDGAVAAIDRLPVVAEAVDDEAVVGLDSGVRTGVDAFKALALGADFVGIGRPYLFALALGGRRGVREVVLNLLAELESVMGLSGCPTLGSIDDRAVVPRDGRPR